MRESAMGVAETTARYQEFAALSDFWMLVSRLAQCAKLFLEDCEPSGPTAHPAIALVECVRNALRFDDGGPFNQLAEDDERTERCTGCSCPSRRLMESGACRVLPGDVIRGGSRGRSGSGGGESIAGTPRDHSRTRSRTAPMRETIGTRTRTAGWRWKIRLHRTCARAAGADKI